MDFSISQFTGDTSITEAKASPLALVKNDYSSADASINYASSPETSNIFRHLPSHMYASIVSGYTRPDAFSRSCFPYVHVTTTVPSTTSDGMSFFPYVGSIQHPTSHLQQEQQQQQLEQEDHLKSACSTNPMHNEQTCYYSNENQEYLADNEQMTSVAEPYKYETLNNFKEPDEDDEVIQTRMDEGLSDWATAPAIVNASSESMVHSAEVSRTSTHQAYSGTGERDGLLDCSNRSPASKTYDETGADYCSTDQSINASQSQQQVQSNDQSFQEPSTVYMTQGLSIPSNQQTTYPQTAACTQSTVMTSMVPYQYISSGFAGGDPSTPHMEGIVSPNFVFNGTHPTGTINAYADEMANSHGMGINPDSMENPLEKCLYSRELILQPFPT